MTIRQIENLTGMTRANIRYYEHEGLISPHRGENDYRDYSERDLTALLKIKLLRQLQVPLEDIRKLQSGEMALSAVLEEKLRQLETQIADCKNAADICRDIRASEMNYAELDAKKYLNWISTVAPTGSDYFSVRSDELPKAQYPWRRFFARGLDFALYSLIWSAVCHLAFRWNPGAGTLINLVNTYITFGLMLIVDPILLSTLGTTPGKWIFGLQVRDFDGKKLCFSDALARTWGMFHYGYGYALPFYNLYRHYQSYKICRETGELQWDEDICYTIKDLRFIRALAFILANALLVGFAVLIVLQAEMPRHRGDISAEEFAQNFNDLMDYMQIDYGMHLDANGKWTEDPSDGTYVLNLGPSKPDFELTETNGILTRVFFEASSATPEVISDSFTYQMHLAILSYLCAQKEINVFNCRSVLSPDNTAFTNFEYTKAGITVKCSVEYAGYSPAGQDILFPNDDEKQSFHLVFSMEKAA